MDLDRCCALLGVSSEDSDEEIKRTYRNLVREWHPDRHQGDPGKQSKAEVRIKEINVAYERIQAIRQNPHSSNGHSRPQAAPNGSRPPQPAGKRTAANGAGETRSRRDADLQTANVSYQEGVEHSKAGRWEKAISSFMQTVCLRPSHGDAYYALGVAYREVDRPAKAVAALKQAIRLLPGCAEAYTHLGRASLDLVDATEAAWAVSRMKKHAALDAEAYIILGIAYRLLRRYHQALEALNEAIKLEPGSPEAHYELGEAQLASGDVAAARSQHARLKKLDADLAVQLLLSIIDSKVPQGAHRDGL
jgi:tetratricopeptide (TPR) repeat protein